MAFSRSDDILIQCPQASLTIKECFKKLKASNLNAAKVEELGTHLMQHKKVDSKQWQDILKHEPRKDVRLARMENVLLETDRYTCEAILNWIEQKEQNLKNAKEAIESFELQYVLESLFKAQNKPNRADAVDHFKDLMEASNTVCGTEKNDPDSLYIVLAKVINEATNEKEATSQLTSGNVRNDTVQFLKTNIPKVDQMKAISVQAAKNWNGYIERFEKPGIPGDPFVIYAAAAYYQVHVHVTSGVTEEEYTFYPTNKPSARASCSHVYIGHIEKRHYISLFPKDHNDELSALKQRQQELENEKEEMKQQYQQQLQKLQTEMVEQETARTESGQNIKKTIEELKKTSKKVESKFHSELSALKERNDKLQGKIEHLENENLKMCDKNKKQENRLNSLEKEVHDLKTTLFGDLTKSEKRKAQRPMWDDNYIHDKSLSDSVGSRADRKDQIPKFKKIPPIQPSSASSRNTESDLDSTHQ